MVLLFGSIYQHFTFLQILPVLPGFVVKHNAVQYRFTAMGKISRDCDKDVTSGKSWSSRCFLREFVG